MPVSESEKLGVYVPGYHFSEKAEHIPIKKRRILFRASSPPPSTTNPLPEGAESHDTSPTLNSNASPVPDTHETVTGICEKGSEDHKPDKKELVKDDDLSGTSILAAATAACSNSLVTEADQGEGSGMVSSVTKTPEVPKTVEFKVINVKKEPNSHISTTPSKVDESTLNNSSSRVPLELALSKTNQEPSIEKSTAQDARFSWDLNTVMDAWEEPHVSEHQILNDKAAYVEQKKNCCTEVNSEILNDKAAYVEEKKNSCMEFESPSKSVITQNLPVELNNLVHESKELKVEKLELLSHKIDSAQHAVFVKTESLDDNHTDCASGTNLVNRTLSMEIPTHGSSPKANLCIQTPSKSIIKQHLPVELNNLAYANKELKMEICELMSHEAESAQHAAVVKTEPLDDKHTDSASDSIPVRTLSLENPTHGIFSKSLNLSGQSSGGFGSMQAVHTKLSIDRSMLLGFDHCLNSCASKENVGPTPQTVTGRHDLSLKTATCVENGPHQSGITSKKVGDEAVTKMELTSNMVAADYLVKKDENDKISSKVVMEDKPVAISSMHNAAHSDADNSVGYRNSQNEDKAGSGIVKQDANSVGYDSQYEDGELREWTINAWKGYKLTADENEYKNREIGLDLGISDACETNSQNEQEGSSGTIKLTGVAPRKEADLTSRVVLQGKLHSCDDVLSSQEPNELTSGQEKSERQDNVEQHASQSDEWKMNVSGRELFLESQRINSNSFGKARSFTGRKFSYREEQKDKFDTENVETKTQGSRFYRKDSLTGTGGPSARNVFLSRGRFQMQGCSSNEGDGLNYRPDRELGALRPFGRGRYSPNNRPSGREGGMLNRSLESGRDLRRLPSPSYQGDTSFRRSILEDSGMDPSDVGRQNISSYVSRRPFRSRSPTNQEVNDFRARLGLRPTGDAGHDRFVNLSRGRGMGRSMRYAARLDEEGPRGRYHGPASDECDDLMTEYSHPFPKRHQCFSPTERRANNVYQHHQSNSMSPSRPRTRSPVGNNIFRRNRSPGSRLDARIRRPRSPGYRDHSSEYNSGPRNNNTSPPSSRWVNYRERPVFNRSPPPGRANGPQVERFSFYDSSLKTKQNEFYRSGHPGKLSDLNEIGRGRPRYVDDDGDGLNNGYRRGGFVRRYNEDGPAKRFQYDDEDGCSRGFDARDRHALEIHARLKQKPCSDGTDSRFRDLNNLQ